MRSGNPALRESIYTGQHSMSGKDAMTVQGAINKCFILFGLTVATAVYAWKNPQMFAPYLMPIVIVAFVIALVTIFKSTWSPVLAPVYALLEGLALGVISLFFETQFPGIAMQAVGLTFGVFFTMLVLYKSGTIRATGTFKKVVIGATAAIALVYIASMIMNMFGARIPYIHGSGPIGIGFSVFVVAIAALNLVLDFDFIEQSAQSGAPKYLEWYSAFSLLVTLVWLYLEILRLLSKLRD